MIYQLSLIQHVNANYKASNEYMIKLFDVLIKAADFIVTENFYFETAEMFRMIFQKVLVQQTII